MSQSASLHALAAAQMSQQTAESVGPSSAAAAATAASAAAAGAGGAMLFSPPPPRFTPSASSTSAAAAAAAAAPKRASVLLVHAGCYALDHSIVRITNDDSLLFRTPHRLLSLNEQLLKPFTAPYDQKHVGDFVVSEFTLVLLHLLSALHDQQLEHHHGQPLVVTMLTRTALSEEVKQRISPGAGAAASSAAAAIARTSRSKAGQQLRFTAERASPILLRWCDSWSDATCGSNPPCVVYLPTLFWLLRVCSLDQAGAVLDTMLKEINASLWPPKSWEELVENKDQVFRKFNKYMQPARWASLRSPSCNTVAKLAEDLLYFCRVRGDGRYFVKASHTCDADCARRITVADGKCPELLSLLTAWAGGMHQHCFGIQPFVPGFGDFELRTWLVPDHDTKRWRQVLTIKTKLGVTGDLWGEQFQPLHVPGLRIAQLIDTMTAEQAAFFEHLRQLGVPALRIDCGYDEANGAAFFNEFAVCEAWMWSEVHGQDLAYVVGRAAGDRVWKLLEEAS